MAPLLPSAKTAFAITGMTCQGCARNVANAIQSVAGVADASVELATHRATVRWQPDTPPAVDAVIASVKRAGFQAALAEGAATAGTQDRAPADSWSPLAGWRFNVVLGGLVTLTLMTGEWGFRLGMDHWFQWLAFCLALPVQVIGGARFYRGAFNQLRVGNANMDTLVALGSTTAFAYSAWGLFAGWATHLYFMEAAGIITLISVGHWLEANASARAADALRSLLQLAPPKARWLSAAGVETEVPVANLAEDDRVLLKPGDRVPTDGEVCDGASTVDESMLTGESMPVEKALGAKVYAGTVNQDGRLVVRVTATGESTALAQIIAVVQRAQNSRASIQKLGDRVSGVFVPVVVLVALATGLWWGWAYPSASRAAQAVMPWLWPVGFPATPVAAAFIHAAAVLIVACPCAMGLATPVAIMVGANVAARRGILIRDGAALEKSGRITAVVFDKTGTLTEGQARVTATEDFRPPTDRSPPLAALATALARPSNHPLSRAMANGPWPIADSQSGKSDLSEDRGAAVGDWLEVRGRGVQATLAGATLRLGSLTWLAALNVHLAPATSFVEQQASRGATVLGLAAGQQLLGVFALSDMLKPHAGEVVRRLADQGLRVFLVTGDHASTAAAVARAAGILASNVFAEVRPEGKAELVRQWRARGERVAFVGDGINDAPALEQADLGIAVSRASDVAREAADLILLRSDIDAIPEALGLAQATLRTIKQNLFWAFFYNAAAVPLAALGFLSPMLCAAAMGLSDLLVIGNALRLRRWKMK